MEVILLQKNFFFFSIHEQNWSYRFKDALAQSVMQSVVLQTVY